MFNTGDIARWREDGCLEMLGRKDDQVKIKVSLGILRVSISKISRAFGWSLTGSPVLLR